MSRTSSASNRRTRMWLSNSLVGSSSAAVGAEEDADHYRRPRRERTVKRLFVEEDDDGDEDEGGGGPLRGQRIFILSFQGDLLYTYAHPDGHYFGSICNFDGKLLAPAFDSCGAWTMAAFRGL